MLALPCQCPGCAGDEALPAATPEPDVIRAGHESVSRGLNDAAQPNGERAFRYLVQLCDIGPRTSGTDGMRRQQELIEEHFTACGAALQYQPFDAPHPQTGQPVRMNNMIVSWQPEAKTRVLVCCHYDTRPFPDRDPVPANRTRPFIGANDGASGVALLMELGHFLPDLSPRYGVDFVFFDGEELVYDSNRDKYFLGSEHFAKEYRDRPPAHRYAYGVLLDMVADRDFRVFYEVNSLKYAPDVTRSVWDAAKQAGVREFVARRKHEVRDDHLPLNEIARIPTCDVIDFDYPHWHTRNDLPAACSGQTLAKVGRVMLTWLSNLPAAPQN
jgi:hypothetical protein